MFPCFNFKCPWSKCNLLLWFYRVCLLSLPYIWFSKHVNMFRPCNWFCSFFFRCSYLLHCLVSVLSSIVSIVLWHFYTCNFCSCSYIPCCFDLLSMHVLNTHLYESLPHLQCYISLIFLCILLDFLWYQFGQEFHLISALLLTLIYRLVAASSPKCNSKPNQLGFSKFDNKF